MRLNKYIAHYSSYSRREADKVIQNGYVRVNGEIEDNPATQVEEGIDIVYVSGKQVSPKEKYTVIVYNKPKGELVTKSDLEGEKLYMMDLIKSTDTIYQLEGLTMLLRGFYYSQMPQGLQLL